MRFVGLLLLGVLFSSFALAQGGSQLHVGVQTPAGISLPGAVVLLDGGEGAAADADGVATLEVTPGTHTVRVSFLGFVTREVEVSLDGPGPWGLLVELQEDVAALEGVVVEAKDLRQTQLGRSGFFQRSRRGFGTALTSEDLAERSPAVLSSALLGVQGVAVRRTAAGSIAVSTRGGCRMRVFVDGVFNDILTGDIDLFPIQDLAAIEVFSDAQVPIQYRSSGGANPCGAVLLWTRFSAE